MIRCPHCGQMIDNEDTLEEMDPDYQQYIESRRRNDKPPLQ